jgi:protease IV
MSGLLGKAFRAIILTQLVLGSLVCAQEIPTPDSLFSDEVAAHAKADDQVEGKDEAKQDPICEAKHDPHQTTEPSETQTDSGAKPEHSSEDDTSKKSARSKAEPSDTPQQANKPPANSTDKASAKKQLRQLSLGGMYVDYMEPLSFDPSSLLLGGTPAKQKSFVRLLDYLDELSKEAAVSHILFDLSDANIILNSAQLDELVRRMEAVKQNGKRLIAWLENADNTHLAIAAQCDDIILTDFGGLDMPSAALETTFYRDAMDLIGVKASVVRAGDFKGAVEPYLNSQMSDHLRDHYIKMLESINSARVSRIAKGRGLTTAAVRELQKKRMLLPAEALAAGLVTKLAPYGSMKKTVQEMVGDDVQWTTPKAKAKKEMSFFELMGKIMGGAEEATVKLKDDTIVVMHLSGPIEDGKEPSSGSIVSGPTVKAINELTKDDKVKGVVVRINSPGGSATASEAIRQALAELASKKPLVYSMGDVAASGGYWVTCIGQQIYAERGTITGSIGVFSMKISLGTLMKRIGVHVESVAIDPAASMDAMDRAWTDDEIGNYQRFIDDVYQRFLALASESRKIPIDKLKTLAGGRVWSGEQAKAAGLIDEIGGIRDCIGVIAKRAGVEKYKVVHRPEPVSSMGLFSLFEEADEDDIGVSAVEQHITTNLNKLGLKLDGLRTILRAAVKQPGARPTVWALTPGELQVR